MLSSETKSTQIVTPFINNNHKISLHKIITTKLQALLHTFYSPSIDKYQPVSNTGPGRGMICDEVPLL